MGRINPAPAGFFFALKPHLQEAVGEGPDGVHHCVKAVRAGRGEMVAQTDCADEKRFGVRDLPGAATRVDAGQQCNEA